MTANGLFCPDLMPPPGEFFTNRVELLEISRRMRYTGAVDSVSPGKIPEIGRRNRRLVHLTLLDGPVMDFCMSLPQPESRSNECSANPAAAHVHVPTPAAGQTAAGIEEIVAQCRRGDRAGQSELFALFHRRVYRLAARMVGERDAPDITQDVFLRVFQKIDQFRGDSRLDTWLHRITVNECLQWLRRRGSRNEQSLVKEPATQSDHPFEQMEHRELLELALEQLEPDVRSVFLLREVEGMNYAEIAEATQLAEGTVASRLNRARRRLREILVDLGWEP